MNLSDQEINKVARSLKQSFLADFEALEGAIRLSKGGRALVGPNWIYHLKESLYGSLVTIRKVEAERRRRDLDTLWNFIPTKETINQALNAGEQTT